jgi:hypothetical protein
LEASGVSTFCIRFLVTIFQMIRWRLRFRSILGYGSPGSDAAYSAAAASALVLSEHVPGSALGQQAGAGPVAGCDGWAGSNDCECRRPASQLASLDKSRRNNGRTLRRESLLKIHIAQVVPTLRMHPDCDQVEARWAAPAPSPRRLRIGSAYRFLVYFGASASQVAAVQ